MVRRQHEVDVLQNAVGGALTACQQTRIIAVFTRYYLYVFFCTIAICASSAAWHIVQQTDKREVLVQKYKKGA